MAATTGPHPRKLGRYDILERLATGGMAEILLACERGVRGLERLVVVKKILPHLAVQESFVDMFVQEARIVARLSHPNVVQIHDLAEENGEVFIAMEYVPGSTLRQLTEAVEAQGVQIPVEVAVGMITQACRGAHAAHELRDREGRALGLVHRDISPHNLMVTPEGHVKLLDFGIAKATENVENTATGTLKGKYCYMSPEQARHEPLDRRSDIFALGIVFWELLAMKRLFKRESELASMQAIVDEDAPRIDVLRPDVPAAVALVLSRALAREKDARISTADDFRRQLTDAAEAAGLNLNDDVVGRFVAEVLGAEHQARQQRVDQAVEMTLARTPSVRHRELEPTLQARPLPDKDAVTAAEIPSRRHAEAPTALRLDAPVVLDAPRAPNRGRALLVAILAAVAGAAVAVGALFMLTAPVEPPPVVLSGPPLRVGFPPVMDAELQSRELEPLRLYLQKTLRRPVRFPNTTSYDELSNKVIQGEYQFGSFPPYLYLKTHAAEPRVAVMAFKLFAGSSGTDGVILVPEDSTAASLKDLKDKTFCFTDRSSLTGFMLPRAALKLAGLDVDAVVARAHFSGDHLQVLRDLVEHKCDAGATYSGAYLSADRANIPVARLRVLSITGRSPHDAICAGPSATPEERTELINALLAFDPQRHVGQEMLGTVQRISGFSRGSDDAYDTLRSTLIRSGVLPSSASTQ